MNDALKVGLIGRFRDARVRVFENSRPALFRSIEGTASPGNRLLELAELGACVEALGISLHKVGGDRRVLMARGDSLVALEGPDWGRAVDTKVGRTAVETYRGEAHAPSQGSPGNPRGEGSPDNGGTPAVLKSPKGSPGNLPIDATPVLEGRNLAAEDESRDALDEWENSLLNAT